MDEKNRMNPRNGITINPLPDKAFENSYITITPDYKVKVSTGISKNMNLTNHADFFLKYDNATVILPNRFYPDPEKPV
ncbi:hypothetical protein [Litoribacter populi]|uniref:hypothetical protein n=1 Tax=Litoribacter populi TaxID=2598460 RepID=UPI00163DAC7A|nr:hypothetical protein [Litoribacter populi]